METMTTSMNTGPYPNQAPQKNHNIMKSYLTKAQVPYVRDDELPSFSGAQGAVYKATLTTSTGLLRRTHVQAFAIKEIRLRDFQARLRLRNEIKHLHLCDHPNILKLREAYTIEQGQWIDTTFLVTQPWAQASLQRFIESVANSKDGSSSLCPWYVPQSLNPWPEVIRQCILGVKHIHDNLIKHKDLKPDNILLLDESDNDYSNPKVRPVIADFGISKEYAAEARTTFSGTDQYLAPEQVAKESSTPKSDIFSLGCCFAWVHSILCSKPWDNGSEDDQSIFQLEELVCVGFSQTAEQIPGLLQKLRQGLGLMVPNKADFTLILEEIIKDMLVANPDERATLESLLKRIDSYQDKWQDFKLRKFIMLCVTRGWMTRYKEIDISDIQTDTELFEMINRHFINVSHRLNLLLFALSIATPVIDDVRFIKFALNQGVFEVLEGAESVPPASLVTLREYECHLGVQNDVPIPPSLFINLLQRKHHIYSSTTRRLREHVWLDRIPKRIHLTSDLNHVGNPIEIQSNFVGWGIQIAESLPYPRLLLAQMVLTPILITNQILIIADMGNGIWQNPAATAISLATFMMTVISIGALIIILSHDSG